MKLLCKYQGGSHSYGLATKDSDIDYRGVFVNDDVSTLVGLNKHEHQITQTEEQDVAYTELRNALKLLRGANTQMVELLYNDQWLGITEPWDIIQRYRKELVDSRRLFSCLRGYMQGELKLTLGLRTGKLGGKRFAQLEKFGYSPKNAVQCLRLLWAGGIYFTRGYFPVNISKEDKVFSNKLLDIKTHAEKFSKEQIESEILEAEQEMIKKFESRVIETKFNETLADELCLRIYGPLINEQYLKLVFPIASHEHEY
jgi:hypothetical protein